MKKVISLSLALIMLLTYFSAVGFAAPVINDTTEILFTENFDAASENVTISNNTFSYIARPEDGADVSSQEAYGVLMSGTAAASKVKINFNELYTGEFTYEMDFRLEDVISEDSNEIKLLRLNKNDTAIGLITLWDSGESGYKIRVATRDEEGNAKYKISGYIQHKKWYTLRVVINTFENKQDVYVNDVLVCENCLPYKNSFEGGINNADVYTDKAKNTSLLIDNISLYRDLGVYSNAYVVSDDVILSDFENVSVADFISNIEMSMQSALTLYSDYDAKVQNTGTVADGDILEVKSTKDTTNVKLYTINSIAYANTYYVSPTGNNLNDGTTPSTAFVSLDYAKSIVRLAKQKNPNQAYTVKILSGDYVINSIVEFTAEDSGSAEYPIIYEAYGNGPVNFKGSVTLQADNKNISKVTDPEILDTIISEDAKTQLWQIDLYALGIEIPKMPENYGFSRGGYSPLRIYINGQALTEAQFPNAGDVHISIKSMNNGDTCTTDGYYDFNYYDADAPFSRTSLWDTENRNIYVAGTIGTQYSYNHILVDNFDPENTRIKTADAISFAPAIGRAYFYFTNIMEEIDVPGESYLDEENGILYFYPYENMENATVEIGVNKNNMIKMTDADYITFKNLNFGYNRSKIFETENTDYLTIDGCEIAHTGATAMTVNGTNITIQNNHIYDLAGYVGTGGIHMTGNDSRKDLISDNNKIINNKIHDTDVVYKVSQSPAIYLLDSVGTEISNNEIYNGTAYVIRVTDANDILIKRNEIYNAVTMSSDAGAVTWGRDITLLGFKVIENYFHDIGNDIGIREQESTGQECKRTGQQALFHDDGSSGPYAYGNIFYQCKPNGTRNTYYSIKANGGQYGIWENNIFIGGESAAYYGSWRTGYTGNTTQDIWWLRQYNVYEIPRDADGKGGTAIYWDRISNSALNFFENDLWKEKYASQYGAYWTLFTPAQKEYLESVYDPTVSNIKYNSNLLDAAAEHADLITNTNVMKNNILIDTLTPIEHKDTANYHEAEGSVTGIYTTDEAQGFFKNYGTDFTLTDAGLSEVQKTVPAFETIDFSLIGLQSEIGKESAGVTIQNEVYEKDKVTMNIVNDSNVAKTGLLVVVTSNGDATAEIKFTAIAVPGKTAVPQTVALTKAYDKAKVFVLKDVFSMQILSNVIEK